MGGEIKISILPIACLSRSEEYDEGYEDDYEEEDCGDDDYCTYSEVLTRKKLRKMMMITFLIRIAKYIISF